MSDFAPMKNPSFPDRVCALLSRGTMEVWKPLFSSVKLQHHVPCRQKRRQHPEQAQAGRRSQPEGLCLPPPSKLPGGPTSHEGEEGKEGQAEPPDGSRPKVGPLIYAQDLTSCLTVMTQSRNLGFLK